MSRLPSLSSTTRIEDRDCSGPTLSTPAATSGGGPAAVSGERAEPFRRRADPLEIRQQRRGVRSFRALLERLADGADTVERRQEHPTGRRDVDGTRLPPRGRQHLVEQGEQLTR